METKVPEGQAESPQEAAAPTKEGGGKPMGMGMMKKMMGQRGQGGEGPMAMMQKMMGQKGEGAESGDNPMQQMMGTCMAMLPSITPCNHLTCASLHHRSPSR